MAILHGASDRCFLFTDVFGRLLQLLLAVVAVLVLYVKRKLEFPVRPIKVWALDVGKQCLGSLFVHVMSIATSVWLVTAATEPGDDECGIYFVTFMADTTWGAVLTVLFLRAIDALAAWLGWTSVAHCGEYGDPPQLRVWWLQFLAYATALALMKVANLVLLWALFPWVARSATKLFGAFEHHRHLELSVVMIIIPGCCNTFQFWLLDSYLKSDTSKPIRVTVGADDVEKRWLRGDVPLSTTQPLVGAGPVVTSVSPL